MPLVCILQVWESWQGYEMWERDTALEVKMKAVSGSAMRLCDIPVWCWHKQKQGMLGRALPVLHYLAWLLNCSTFKRRFYVNLTPGNLFHLVEWIFFFLSLIWNAWSCSACEAATSEACIYSGKMHVLWTLSHTFEITKHCSLYTISLCKRVIYLNNSEQELPSCWVNKSLVNKSATGQ